MSAAIKDATSCCIEESDPYGVSVSVDVCAACKMIPTVNGHFLMPTAIFAFSLQSVDYPVPLLA